MFYIAPGARPTLPHYVLELVSGDTRYVLPADAGENSNYNHNENTSLVSAIERGAYRDILRRTQTGQ